MRCKKARQNLTAFLDEELPANRRDQISRHLEGCASCQKEREALERVRHAFSSLGEEAGGSLPTAQEILRKARVEELPSRASSVKGMITDLLIPGRRLARPVMVAAGLLCAVGLYWLYPSLRGLKVPSPEERYMAERMDLFENLGLIQDLSVLDLLEAAESQDVEAG